VIRGTTGADEPDGLDTTGVNEFGVDEFGPTGVDGPGVNEFDPPEERPTDPVTGVIPTASGSSGLPRLRPPRLELP
jgi:hypothetical protein